MIILSSALIIEDDKKLADIFAAALQEAEFQTEVVQDGKTALTRLTETVPDVVVLDLHLPHSSGVDILRQIRADDRLIGTKVMVATADPLMADSISEEADLVLIKPISFRQLRDLATRLRPLDIIGDE